MVKIAVACLEYLIEFVILYDINNTIIMLSILDIFFLLLLGMRLIVYLYLFLFLFYELTLHHILIQSNLNILKHNIS